MNKRGAELSVNVIIIAIIALLVLVVLFAIFTGRMAWFNHGINQTIHTCSDGSHPVSAPIPGKSCVPVPGSGSNAVEYCCTNK